MKKSFTFLLLTLFCFSIIQLYNPVEASPKGRFAGVDDDGYSYYIESAYPNRKGRSVSTIFVFVNIESPLDENMKSKVVRCSWDYMKEMGGWVVLMDYDKTGRKIDKFVNVRPGTAEYNLLMYLLN